MSQQLLYVAVSYGIGILGFSGLMLWVRHCRRRTLEFLKQSLLIQNHESDSKK